MEYIDKLTDEELEELAIQLGNAPEEGLGVPCLDPAFLDPNFDFGGTAFSAGAADPMLPVIEDTEVLEKIEVPDLITETPDISLKELSQRVENLSEQVQLLTTGLQNMDE
ncbi:hypothetical protein D8B26_005370 [Coccidioides posadasii str. Silveira]|nr:hypothetical protein D8B26_005370 [Coccidioides posadasii str. Silveira]